MLWGHFTHLWKRTCWLMLLVLCGSVEWAEGCPAHDTSQPLPSPTLVRNGIVGGNYEIEFLVDERFLQFEVRFNVSQPAANPCSYDSNSSSAQPMWVTTPSSGQLCMQEITFSIPLEDLFTTCRFKFTAATVAGGTVSFSRTISVNTLQLGPSLRGTQIQFARSSSFALEFSLPTSVLVTDSQITVLLEEPSSKATTDQEALAADIALALGISRSLVRITSIVPAGSCCTRLSVQFAEFGDSIARRFVAMVADPTSPLYSLSSTRSLDPTFAAVVSPTSRSPASPQLPIVPAPQTSRSLGSLVVAVVFVVLSWVVLMSNDMARKPNCRHCLDPCADVYGFVVERCSAKQRFTCAIIAYLAVVVAGAVTAAAVLTQSASAVNDLTAFSNRCVGDTHCVEAQLNCSIVDMNHYNEWSDKCHSDIGAAAKAAVAPVAIEVGIAVCALAAVVVLWVQIVMNFRGEEVREDLRKHMASHHLVEAADGTAAVADGLRRVRRGASWLAAAQSAMVAIHLVVFLLLVYPSLTPQGGCSADTTPTGKLCVPRCSQELCQVPVPGFKYSQNELAAGAGQQSEQHFAVDVAIASERNCVWLSAREGACSSLTAFGSSCYNVAATAPSLPNITRCCVPVDLLFPCMARPVGPYSQTPPSTPPPSECGQWLFDNHNNVLGMSAVTTERNDTAYVFASAGGASCAMQDSVARPSVASLTAFAVFTGVLLVVMLLQGLLADVRLSTAVNDARTKPQHHRERSQRTSSMIGGQFTENSGTEQFQEHPIVSANSQDRDGASPTGQDAIELAALEIIDD